MCRGDDQNCPEFELHRKKLLDELDNERRSFLKSAFVAGGGAAALARRAARLTPRRRRKPPSRQGQPSYHYLPAKADTVHWGYFSKLLKPSARSGQRRLRHHRSADPSRQRRRRAHGQGRSGRRKRVPVDQGQEGRQPPRRRSDRRQAAGPRRWRGLRRAHLHRSGLYPRRRARRHPRSSHHGREAAAVRQSRPMPANRSAATRRRGGASTTTTCSPSPKPREVCTIYEIDTSGQRNWAQAVYNFRWTPQTDPFGVVHKIIDYPGVPVDHARSRRTTAS